MLPVSTFEASLPKPLLSAIAALVEVEGEEEQQAGRLEKIRSAIDATEWPVSVHENVCSAYRELGGAVAVRSSGTIEDGDRSAFAGAFSSFLNRVGCTHVLESIKECWKSAFTTRVAAYRTEHGLWSSPWTLGVIVQEMVNAEQAGVMFTRNPFTGDDTLVIEAVRGGCEQIVTGAPAELSLRIDRSNRHVVHADEPLPRARFGGGTGSILRTSPTLRPKLLRRWAIEQLVDVGLRLEAEFGRAQDIEWAISKGKLLLLQARPLTALQPVERTT